MKKKALFEQYIDKFNLKEHILLNQVKAVLLANGLEIDNAHNIAMIMKTAPFFDIETVIYYYQKLRGLEETNVSQLYSRSRIFPQGQADAPPYNFFYYKTSSEKLSNSLIVMINDSIFFVKDADSVKNLVKTEVTKLGKNLYKDFNFDEFIDFVAGKHSEDKLSTVISYVFIGKVEKTKDGFTITCTKELLSKSKEIKNKFKGSKFVVDDSISSRPSIEQWVNEFIGQKNKNRKTSFIVKLSDPRGFARPDNLIPHQFEDIWEEALFEMRDEDLLFDDNKNPNYSEAFAHYDKMLTDRVNKLEKAVDEIESKKPVIDIRYKWI